MKKFFIFMAFVLYTCTTATAAAQPESIAPDHQVVQASDVQFDTRELVNAFDANPATVANIINKLGEAGSDAPNLWKALPVDIQDSVMQSLKAVRIENKTTISEEVQPSTNKAASTVRSKSVENKSCLKNGFGANLGCYFNKVDWKYDGSKVTYKFMTRRAEVYYPLWEFRGHIGNTESGGVGSKSYRAYTQGSFAFCAVYVACVQFKYPWVDTTVYGSGTYSLKYGM